MSVINTSALAGASGQAAGGDYEIQRSLRFNSGDSSHLAKTFSTDSTTFSISFWFKRTNINPGNIYNHIFNSNSGSGFGIATYQDFIYLYNNAHPYTSGRLLRDPSAWYHVFVSSNSGSASLYVNNQLVQTVTGASYGSTARIGGWNGGSYFTDGYLADVHFLDGIAASASDFGEYDDNNVWQPKKYEGSYNAAGSGVIYSGMLSASNGFNIAATSAFDGDTTTEARANLSTDNYLEFTPTTPISFTNGAHVWCYSPNGFGITNYWSVDLDGNGLGSETSFVGSSTANFNGSAWVQVATGSGTLHKVRIRLTRSGGSSGAAIGAFAINGTSAGNILVDGTVAGVNGFHLDFSDNSSDSALGTDSSGNSNDWTVTNLSTTEVSSVTNPTWYAASSYYSDVADVIANGTNKGSGAWTASSEFVYLVINDGGTPGSNNVSAGNMPISWVMYRNTGGTLTRQGSFGSTEFPSFDWSDSTGTYTIANSADYYLFSDEDANPPTNGAFSGSIPALTTASFITANDINKNLDVLFDAPTNGTQSDTGAGGEVSGNYCTWNPLIITTNNSLANGNLEASHAANTSWTGGLYANYAMHVGSMGVTSGKYYWEGVFTSGNIGVVGVVNKPHGHTYYVGYGDTSAKSVGFGSTHVYNNGFGSYVSSMPSISLGDIIGVAIDMDNGKLYFSVNGTYINSGNPAAGTGNVASGLDGETIFPAVSHINAADGCSFTANFGQRQFNTAAPSGYKALCTANLLDPLIEDPSEHFDTKLWDGNNSTRDITGYNFSPDIVWTKKRSSDDFHALFDKIRGVHNAIRPNHPGNTYTDNALLTDFNSDGFEIGNAGAINASGGTYVGWAWEGGDLVTNSAYSQSQTWSDSLTSSTGFRGSEPAANAFDGSTSTTCSAVGSGIVTYTSPVTVSSSETIRVYVNGGTTNVSVNGGSDQAVSAGSFVTLQFDNPSTTPFTLAFQRPGGADTGVKAIEIGGKVLVDPGVIPIASLNSVMYNKSQTWSTYGTFDDNYGGSYVWAGVFNTDNYFTSNRSLYVSSGTDKWTLTSSISVSSSVEIRTYGNTTIELNADLSDATSKTSTGGSTHHHMTIPFTGNLSSISVSGSGVYLCAVYVDGKQLVDPNLTNYYHDSPSISSTVRANTTAGVSIVQYTGTMSSGDRVAHGLNAAPSVLLIKNTATDNTPWQMYHTVGGNQWSIEPNEGEQPNTSSSNWYYQSPNSSVFYLGGNANVNASATNSMIAYCFAEVEGFSSFGGFEGNSSPNGPFIYTGFKPAFLIIKGYDANHYWAMHDIARDPTNTGGKHYFWLNEDNLETNDGGGSDVDFLSNGFKLRNNGGNWNTAGSYLYLAFAANPFKTGRAH